jgi:hypothetical protein
MYWSKSKKGKCIAEDYSILKNGEISLNNIADNTDCVNA